MSRALGPRPPMAAGNAALAWTLIIIFWSLAGLAWLAWAAARLAAAVAGARIPPFSVHWVSALLHGRTANAWPGTPTALVAVTGAVLAAALAAVTVTAWRIIARRATRPGDPVAATRGVGVPGQASAVRPCSRAETQWTLNGGMPAPAAAAASRAAAQALSLIHI